MTEAFTADGRASRNQPATDPSGTTGRLAAWLADGSIDLAPDDVRIPG